MVLGERVHLPLLFAGRAPLEQRLHLFLDRCHLLLEGGAVVVSLELFPGVEDVPGHLEPVEAERLLRAGAEVGAAEAFWLRGQSFMCAVPFRRDSSSAARMASSFSGE